MSARVARKVVVFGGSGYVGSAIARALVRLRAELETVAPSSSSTTSSSSTSTSGADAWAIEIVCASRSGRAPSWALGESWSSACAWTSCDALDEAACAEATRDASAVVTAIGALPFPWVSAEAIVRANGDTNITPGRAAMANGAKKLVVIGATVPPLVPGLASYARGKANVEAFARDEFASVRDGRSAVVLKPAAVSGTRRLSNGLAVPLGLAMDPARAVLRATGVGALLENAPVPLENLALAAAREALSDVSGGGFKVISNRSLIEDFSA